MNEASSGESARLIDGGFGLRAGGGGGGGELGGKDQKENKSGPKELTRH